MMPASAVKYLESAAFANISSSLILLSIF